MVSKENKIQIIDALKRFIESKSYYQVRINAIEVLTKISNDEDDFNGNK